MSSLPLLSFSHLVFFLYLVLSLILISHVISCPLFAFLLYFKSPLSPPRFTFSFFFFHILKIFWILIILFTLPAFLFMRLPFFPRFIYLFPPFSNIFLLPFLILPLPASSSYTSLSFPPSLPLPFISPCIPTFAFLSFPPSLPLLGLTSFLRSLPPSVRPHLSGREPLADPFPLVRSLKKGQEGRGRGKFRKSGREI